MSKVGGGPITPVDLRSPVHRYRQVADDLTSRIAANQFTPDLPSERALVEQYGVSYNTVRNAMKRLQKERLVVTLHGLGSYVTDTARKRFGLCPSE